MKTKVSTRKGVSLVRRILFITISIIAGIFFLIVLGLFLALLIFVVRYELWSRDQADSIQSIAVDDVEDRESVSSELYDRLREFQGSQIQREELFLTCDMVNVFVEDVAEENWPGVERQDVGVTCAERSLSVYTKALDLWWITVKIWQRAEGEVDILVYDIDLGPFSLAGLTFGHVSGQVTEGVSDAIEIVSSESYSGRKIERMHVTEDGVRLVGILPEPEDVEERANSGVDSQ